MIEGTIGNSANRSRSDGLPADEEHMPPRKRPEATKRKRVKPIHHNGRP